MLRYKKQTNAKGRGQYAPFFIRAPKPKRKNSRIYSPFYLQWGSASAGMSCKILPLFAFWRGGSA